MGNDKSWRRVKPLCNYFRYAFVPEQRQCIYFPYVVLDEMKLIILNLVQSYLKEKG